MKFNNLQAELILNDKLDLLSVQLELSFQGENVELKRLIDNYFHGCKITTRLDTPEINRVANKVPLTDDGKESIKIIVKELTELDKQFADRANLVDEFKKLLEE
jgi:hypothetical protein